MKKLLLGIIFLALLLAVPIPTMAGVHIGVGISLPPIVFAAPPAVVVMPDTDDVYVAPDIGVDLFFWNGWWWRPYEGGWYRSHYYDRGWGYYNSVPSFYYDVDPGWRGYYQNHNWYGHQWNYDRISNQQLQQNWNSWHNNRYWESQKTWGVQGYQPRPQQQRQQLRQQRQQQYQQQYQGKSQLQQTQGQGQQHQGKAQHQQSQGQGQQHQGKSQHQQSQGQGQQHQGKSQHQQSQGQGQQHQRKSQHQQSQGKSDGGNAGHSK